MKNDALAPLPRNPEQIRAELDLARRELADSIDVLKVELAQAGDFRFWYQRHPALMLAGAFTLGFFLGSRRRT